ncbi:MAG: TIGR00730 family Rossman fold protein [Deltaproteobacteria bacterium]|nr:TIGR00730 family Rossman fold protein [Deltaproteobacteria bacterium]
MSARTFRRICVFCGSSPGHDRVYGDAAANLGAFLAHQGIGLVYGGGKVGLMGALADGALSAGGEVIGVIPEKLKALEVGHDHLTELFVVDSMHARKAMMAHLSDAFIALPGGWGTLEEIFEVTTWTQLNYHHKPVGLLNVRGYFDHLQAFLQHAGAAGFIRPVHQSLMSVASSPEELLEALTYAEIPDLAKWIKKL